MQAKRVVHEPLNQCNPDEVHIMCQREADTNKVRLPTLLSRLFTSELLNTLLYSDLTVERYFWSAMTICVGIRAGIEQLEPIV